MRTLITLAFVIVSSAAFAGDSNSATIDPYAHLDDTRAELAEAYPELTEAELDRLVFRIADANSVRSLNTKEQIASAK